ncbi:MAG: hypothetical protein AAGF98_15285 [Cyanobacteria bacterium P01_H01_bin.153]
MVKPVFEEKAVMQLVIGVNIAIAVLGFFVAWRLWKLKRTLTSATVALDSLERQTRLTLDAKSVLTQLQQGREAVVLTRTRYRQLQQQLHQLQQIFATTVIMVRLVRGVVNARSRQSQKR